VTEIPLPPMGGEPRAQKPSSGLGFCKIIIVIAVIGIVIVAGFVLVMFSNLMSIIPTTTTSTTTTSPQYYTRQVTEYLDTDVDLYTTYYRAEFDVYSYEVQTAVQPDLLFEITVTDTGSDYGNPTIHYAVYNIGLSSFDSLVSGGWSSLDSYLMGQGDDPNPAWDYVNLNNYADTYVWVFWFDASSKTSTWSVDITLTLRYNWVL
jgi:hypothetical protein